MNQVPAGAEITGVEVGRGYNEKDGPHKLYQVHFRTTSGVEDYVTVPEKHYTNEHVVQEVSKVAAQHNALVGTNVNQYAAEQLVENNPFSQVKTANYP